VFKIGWWNKKPKVAVIMISLDLESFCKLEIELTKLRHSMSDVMFALESGTKFSTWEKSINMKPN